MSSNKEKKTTEYLVGVRGFSRALVARLLREKRAEFGRIDSSAPNAATMLAVRNRWAKIEVKRWCTIKVERRFAALARISRELRA